MPRAQFTTRVLAQIFYFTYLSLHGFKYIYIWALIISFWHLLLNCWTLLKLSLALYEFEPTLFEIGVNKNKHESRAEGSGRLPICQGYVSLHWLG